MCFLENFPKLREVRGLKEGHREAKKPTGRSKPSLSDFKVLSHLTFDAAACLKPPLFAQVGEEV